MVTQNLSACFCTLFLQRGGHTLLISSLICEGLGCRSWWAGRDGTKTIRFRADRSYHCATAALLVYYRSCTLQKSSNSALLWRVDSLPIWPCWSSWDSFRSSDIIFRIISISPFCELFQKKFRYLTLFHWYDWIGCVYDDSRRSSFLCR